MFVDDKIYAGMQYNLKHYKQLVAEFESGEKYAKMEEHYRKELDAQSRQISLLNNKIAKVEDKVYRVIKLWLDVLEEAEGEYSEKLKAVKKELKAYQQEIAKLENKVREKTEKCARLSLELEEEQTKNTKLTAQVKRNFENSSLPSSMCLGRAKIANSREKTENKPGAQAGHAFHGRKRLNATEKIEIPVPENILNNPKYKLTGNTISKQIVGVSLSVVVKEVYTQEYVNISTGKTGHAPFPKEFKDDVNYDGSIKAFAFMLANYFAVAHDKICQLFKDLTNGEFTISKGFINNLCEEFSSKSQAEQKTIIDTLMSSPVMNADFTNANVNGCSKQVLVCAAPGTPAALYIARDHKGHLGVKGTPLENYAGTIVHDHDKTFYNYGTAHQECMQHNLRYLTGSIQNEPQLTWNLDMQKVLRKAIHYVNSLKADEELDKAKIEEIKKEYDEALVTAENEYLDTPPSDGYREGYNLYLRLKEYKDSELRFLDDRSVPANNSLCERLARNYKRKQKQATTFRSFENLSHTCTALSVVYLLRFKNGVNLFNFIGEIFNRQKPKTSKVNNEKGGKVA